MKQTKQDKAIMIRLKENDKLLDSKLVEIHKATTGFVDAVKTRDMVKIKDAEKLVTEKTKGLTELTEEKLDLKQRLNIRDENKIVNLWNNSDPNQRAKFLIRTGLDENEISVNSQLGWKSLSPNIQKLVSRRFEDVIVAKVREFRN